MIDDEIVPVWRPTFGNKMSEYGKRGGDQGRKTKQCSICGSFNHNRTKCDGSSHSDSSRNVRDSLRNGSPDGQDA